jgi:hypothetical protein
MTTTDTDSIKSLYTSLPLRRDAKEIRVFHLDPPNLELPDDPIRGTLEVVNIDERPRFVALSYVWGTSSSPPRTITCAQHQIQVTDNLWNALSHLRHDPTQKDPGRNSDGSLTIWIDAICINQSDEEEKLAQIPLMGDIYGSSYSTCIWLGEGSPETDEAVRLARTIGWQERLHPEGDFFYKMPGRGVIWSEGIYDLIIKIRNAFAAIKHNPWRIHSRSVVDIGNGSFVDAQGNISVASLEPILNNIWLWRIWTLQEVALAPNPWIRYGSQCLSWRTVMYSVAFLSWGSRNSFQNGFNGTPYKWQRAIDLWLTIAQPARQEAISYQPAQGLLVSSNFELALTDYYRFLTEVKSISVQGMLLLAIVPFILIFVIIMIVVNIDQNISGTGLLAARIVVGVWLAGLCFVAFPVSRWSTQPQSNVKSKQTVLGAVLQEVCGRDATDPRDKACGVHAVMAKLGIHLKPPEKSSTKSLLYRELSLELLKATQDLNLILGAGGFFPDQPSWIPEWALNRTEYWMPPSFWLEDEPDPANVALALDVDFIWGRCTMKSPANFDVMDDGELIVEGFTIGKVSWCGKSFVRVDEHPQGQECGDVGNDSLAHNIQILQELLRKQREKRKSDGKPPHHTILSYMQRPRTEILQAPTETPVPFGNLDYLKGKKVSATGDCVDWEHPAREIATTLRKHRPSWGSHLSTVCNGLAGRKRVLFWSEDIQFTGLGNCPLGAKTGDEIVLISGVNLPVILRKNEGDHSYCFIGYAIMEFEDIMDGRIWKKLSSQRQGADVARFVLS